MRKLVLLCLVLGNFLEVCAEEKLHLVKILVTGSQRYQQQELVRALGLTENSLVTRAELDAAPRRLSDSGLFTTVEYTFGPASGVRGIEAHFQVKDTEKTLPAEFENFVWWDDASLEADLRKAMPLYHGQIGMSGSFPDVIAAELAKLLLAKGIDGKIVWQQWAAPGQLPSAYRFRISSGAPKVGNIELQGADHLPANALSWFTSALKAHEYLRSEVNKAVEHTLLSNYRERGFLAAKVTSVETVAGEDKNVSLKLTLAEGPQYHMADYRWTGLTVATPDQLSKFVQLKPGDVPNQAQLDLQLQSAKKFLGRFGRMAADIQPAATLSEDKVSYEFKVNEGELYRMGDLDVEGLDTASAQKLRELWKLQAGAPYDNSYTPDFVRHLIMTRPRVVYTCEFLEQQDDAQKVVNVLLQFKAQRQ